MQKLFGGHCEKLHVLAAWNSLPESKLYCCLLLARGKLLNGNSAKSSLANTAWAKCKFRWETNLWYMAFWAALQPQVSFLKSSHSVILLFLLFSFHFAFKQLLSLLCCIFPLQFSVAKARKSISEGNVTGAQFPWSIKGSRQQKCEL